MPENTDKEVYNLLNRAKPIKLDRGPLLRTLFTMAAVLIVIGSAWIAFAYWKAPKGAITSPAEGFQTSHVVAIEGYTKNLPPDRKYIWVTVDVPDLGLCWPKRPINRCNCPFKTKFFERGPNQKFTVSLYAVDRNHHDEILKWFEDCRITKCAAGFPMLPADYRLDTMKLKLKKT